MIGLVLAILMPLRVDPAESAFVELSSPETEAWVGETAELVIRVGVERSFAESALVQLFRRELELPVQVEAPWLEGMKEAIGGLPTRGGPTLALGETIVAFREQDAREVEGRTFRVLEVRLPVRLDAPGVRRLEAPTLRLAYATEFKDDLFNGRVPVDRQEAVIRGTPWSWTVRALPDEGRPPQFSGGIGSLSFRANVDRTAIDVGESLRLELEVTGDGNLDAIEAPPLEALADFHIYGIRKVSGDAKKTFVVDLAPLNTRVRSVPPIRFAYFDPQPPSGYRTIETAPIALEVRASGAEESLPGEPEAPSDLKAVPGVDDIFEIRSLTKRASSEPIRWSRWSITILLALPWLLGAVWIFGRSLMWRDWRDTSAARARRAARRFKRRIRHKWSVPDQVFADYLADRLGCSRASVIDPDLPQRLQKAGIDAAIAEDAERLCERLVGARYGGESVPGAKDAARAIVARLEEGFLRREARS
ncbi:MAG: BatD family protein [Planctomycetota bacterium]